LNRVKQKDDRIAGKAAKGHVNASIRSKARKEQAASETMGLPDWLLNKGWLFGLLLVTATLLVYLPGMRGAFVWDDAAWTSEDSGVLGSSSALRLMWFKPGALQQYYPLTGTTFLFDHLFWGSWTMPYHVENVLLHACAAVLFWRLLRRLRVPGAWLAAAVFALHPVMVESAGWITERKNVLSLCFFLGALLAYGRFTSFWQQEDETAASKGERTPRRWGAYGWAFVLCMAALLAKTTTLCLPAVILLVCWWKRGRIRWRADVIPSLPFFAAAISLALVTAWLEKYRVGASGPEWAYSFLERCLIAGRAFWFYIGKLVWPANLCFLYPRWHLDAGSLGQWIYPLTSAGALLIVWLARGRIGRGPATALFFYVGTLFPVLGFMNAYAMRFSLVWDHWTYLPSLGLIALGAGLIVRATEPLRTPALLPCVAAVLLPLLGVLTWQQTRMYTDMETLWRTTLSRNPGAFMAHNNVGSDLLERGQVEEAIAHFQRALESHPGYAEAHNNLGNALFRKGQVDEAIAHFQQAVHLDPKLGNAHSNLGTALLQKGQVGEAIVHFEAALAISPHISEIHNNLGNALRQSGRLDEAAVHYQAAVELQPANATAWHNLGTTMGVQGKTSAAISSFQRALTLQPDLAEAHHELAKVLLQAGQFGEAVAHFRRALELRPDLAEACYELGDVLDENGQVDEAIALLQRAVQIAPRFAAAQNNLGNALLRKGRVEEALAHYQAAIEAQPSNAYLFNNLAWALATCPQASARNGARAVELAQQAERLSGSKDARILVTLAAAYAEAGRFAEAVKAAERALELSNAQTNSAYAELLREHIRLYQSGSPFRDTGHTNAAPNPGLPKATD
jgi:tetratricopeptide (TPR) repeat protein